MLVNDSNALKRLNSPGNLINRLNEASKNNNRKNNAMSLFIPSTSQKKENIENLEITNKKIENLEIKKAEFFNPFSSPPFSQPQAKIQNQEQAETELPKLGDILENHESQIKLGLAHDKALDLLTHSVELLSAKLDDVKADKLPSVISAASKTVESIRKERSEASKNNKDREVHYHFYTPEQKKISDYEVIDVG